MDVYSHHAELRRAAAEEGRADQSAPQEADTEAETAIARDAATKDFARLWPSDQEGAGASVADDFEPDFWMAATYELGTNPAASAVSGAGASAPREDEPAAARARRDTGQGTPPLPVPFDTALAARRDAALNQAAPGPAVARVAFAALNQMSAQAVNGAP